MIKASNQLHGVGRRKSSVARVWVKPGTGLIQVNEKSIQDYFPTDFERTIVTIPLSVTGKKASLDIQVNVCGGGLTGQADAVKLGIARALLSGDESLRTLLRDHGLLTVDARVKERKKYGQKAARRKFQFVKR